MRYLLFFAALCCSLCLNVQSTKVNITTKNNSKYEIGVAERMQKLLDKYDLSKWIFTHKVIVEDHVIPHSHPVLTLNTKKQGDNELLSTFIHEQIHWYVDEHSESEKEAIAEFRKKYKNVPVRNGKGARDEYSTYLHLIVCYLEYRSMVELVGQQEAERIMRAMNHYTWIYETVLRDEDYLRRTIKRFNLDLVD